jgi:hypothetical protein
MFMKLLTDFVHNFVRNRGRTDPNRSTSRAGVRLSIFYTCRKFPEKNTS